MSRYAAGEQDLFWTGNSAEGHEEQQLYAFGSLNPESTSASAVGTKTWDNVGHQLQGHRGLGLGKSKLKWIKDIDPRKGIGRDFNTV